MRTRGAASVWEQKRFIMRWKEGNCQFRQIGAAITIAALADGRGVRPNIIQGYFAIWGYFAALATFTPFEEDA